MDRNEKWKPVQRFEDAYQVSNQGRVRSIDRRVDHQGGKRFVKGQFLLPHKIPKGYLQVTLKFNGQSRVALVHRLVAEAFLPPPPYQNMCIDHINMNKADNRADNLEWVTHQENTKRAWENGACNKTLENRSTKVFNNLTGRDYPSIIGASRETGIPYSTLHRYLKNSKWGWEYA